MSEYSRKEPYYSLCGLNCCLCPRFHTDGSSKCPGCGGPNFSKQHPTCAVVTCSKKHGNIEFCFQCNEYPCKKYQEPSKVDSFISYKEVINNMELAKTNLLVYLKQLKIRHRYLSDLLENYNDGKSKGLYCNAMNNLPFSEIEEIMKGIKVNEELEKMSLKDRSKKVVEMFKEKAKELGIEVVLRKKEDV